jgi:phage antirepressor YoqD-like protein
MPLLQKVKDSTKVIKIGEKASNKEVQENQFMYERNRG